MLPKGNRNRCHNSSRIKNRQRKRSWQLSKIMFLWMVRSFRFSAKQWFLKDLQVLRKRYFKTLKMKSESIPKSMNIDAESMLEKGCQNDEQIKQIMSEIWWLKNRSSDVEGVSRRTTQGQLLIREIPTGGNLWKKQNDRKYTTWGEALEHQTRPGAPSDLERIPIRHAAHTPLPPVFVVYGLLRWRCFETCKLSERVSRWAFVISCLLEVLCQFSALAFCIEVDAWQISDRLFEFI